MSCLVKNLHLLQGGVPVPPGDRPLHQGGQAPPQHHRPRPRRIHRRPRAGEAQLQLETKVYTKVRNHGLRAFVWTLDLSSSASDTPHSAAVRSGAASATSSPWPPPTPRTPTAARTTPSTSSVRQSTSSRR